MTFNLDFALFYAYTLTLFAFFALWLLPQLLRALLQGAETWINGNRADSEERNGDRGRHAGHPTTRLEAFTRL